jgi:hypothetical protein
LDCEGDEPAPDPTVVGAVSVVVVVVDVGESLVTDVLPVDWERRPRVIPVVVVGSPCWPAAVVAVV